MKFVCGPRHGQDMPPWLSNSLQDVIDVTDVRWQNMPADDPVLTCQYTRRWFRINDRHVQFFGDVSSTEQDIHAAAAKMFNSVPDPCDSQRAATTPGTLAEMEVRKDAAFLERNQVVAALAKSWPSGVARTAIKGWSEDWHGCVYIDLPTGQTSWHFHDSQAYLFDGLPAYAGKWDGHDTPEKYRRLAAMQPVDMATLKQGVSA